MQNEPNGMLFKPHSKPKNRLFDSFTKPFYAKRTQWYVYGKSMRRQKTLKIPNKANLKMTQMNVTKVLTTDYNSWTLGIVGKTKPIQTQFALSRTYFKAVSACPAPKSLVLWQT